MTADSSPHIVLPDSKALAQLAISESGFVFDPRSGKSFTVNETGRQIIEMLKTYDSFTGIVAELTTQYQADAATIERDLIDFIDVLREQVKA